MVCVIVCLIFFLCGAVAHAQPAVSWVTAQNFGVSSYTPDFAGEDLNRLYGQIVTAIPSAGYSSVFKQNPESGAWGFQQNLPVVVSITGEQNQRAYIYTAGQHIREWFVGNNKANGFFLVLVNSIVRARTWEDGDFGDTFTAAFWCAFVTQNGTYDAIKAEPQLTVLPGDAKLLPVVFELGATNCYFTFKQGSKTFAFEDQLYTVSSSNINVNASQYQLKQNQWPSLFAQALAFAAGINTAGSRVDSCQMFTVDGTKRILPRMWYRTSQSDIAWPASYGYPTLTTNIYAMTDTDGGGQFDLSEYFYRRDPLDAQDDDPNYTQANPDIIAIGIDQGYVSIDDTPTELPSTGDVNIEVDIPGRIDLVKTKLDSKLQSIAPYQAALSILTGVTNRNTRAAPELPKFSFTLPMFGLFGEYDNSYAELGLDFNEIRESTDVWPFFALARVLVGLFIVITDFFTCFNMLYDTLKD